MTLRGTVAANYATQLYVAVAAIAVVPLYVEALGHESYGLVALLGVLSGMVQLLDAGMSATLTREAARLHSGSYSYAAFIRIRRAISRAFVGIAVVAAVAGAAASGAIAAHWIKAAALSQVLVRDGIAIMMAIVLINWIGNPSRGVLRGLERQGSLAAITCASTSLRWMSGVLILYVWHGSVLSFLAGQLVAALLELAALQLTCRFALEKVRLRGPSQSVAQDNDRAVLKFAFSIGFTTMVWIVATQADKLLLSRWLPLAQYAVFSIATTAAAGIVMLNGPIGQALMPRMTALHAQRAESERIAMYRQATRFVCALVGSASMVLAAFAQPALYAWTGDAALAHEAAPILALYALGNGLLAIVALPYYLQYSAGDLDLHVRGNLVFAALLMPSIWLAVKHAGALGAAWVWFGQNLFYFVIWSSVVHARFAPGLHRRWMARDVLATLTGPVLIVAATRMTIESSDHGRLAIALQLAIIGAACFITALATTFGERLSLPLRRLRIRT